MIPAEVLRDHGFPAEFPIEAYEPGGLRALRRHGLPRPHRAVRGDGR